MAPFRMTMATRAVLTALLDRPDACHHGYDLSRAAKIRSGSMYPILSRLLEHGWLADGWEDTDKARAQHRPPRRYYRLTDLGKAEATKALERP